MQEWETEFRENFFKNRDIKDKNKDEFFSFDFEKDNLSPFDFVNMGKSVERLKRAMDNKEKILVYTDYDCDGIPAATVLTDFLNKIGCKTFEVYIPHRHLEGYGLHIEALDRFVCNGYSLVITADLGITNIKEVEYLKSKNVDIILSDHHLPITLEGVEVLPDTQYLINPMVSYETYKNKYLCGAGVAWKLAHAFLVKYRKEYNVIEGWEKWLLDMVAIALVADMMPLVGENRKLVTFGLKVLQKSPRPAIQKICALAKVNQRELNEKDIAFTFAPRINAAGRMDHPILAYKMLADIDGKGLEYVEIIEDLNTKRKQSVKDINSFVKDMTLTNGDGPVLVGNKDWPIGVVGLVAQKIVEDTGRTALVWGMEGDIARGSVRSGKANHNVVNLLAACKEALLHFGGHEQAGGFSLREEKLELLQELLTANSDIAIMKEEKDDATSFVDLSISIKDINQKTFNKLREFAPFGIGNSEPRLELSEKIINTKRFGSEGQHIELSIGGVPSVLFNVTQETERDLKSRESFVGNIEYDNWRKRYQFKIHL